VLSRLRTHLLLLTVNLIYGANYSIAKIALPEHIKPFGFIVVRVVMAALLYWLCHAIFIKEKVAKRDLGLMAVCGLFGVAINQLLFFKGLSITTEINAALIMITAPILVLIISNLLLKEKITYTKLLGILFGAAGVAMLFLWDKKEGFSSGGILGDLYVLINAASYAIYLVIVKPLMSKYHPITVVKWVFLFGMLVVVPVGFKQTTEVNWGHLPGNVWLAVIYVVIGVTFFAYLLNATALKDAKPSLVSIYIYTQPLFATVIAVAVDNDNLTMQKCLSAALIFGGVYLVSMTHRGRARG
jgi:drug/metabolite transporter (DMT)-like permease